MNTSRVSKDNKCRILAFANKHFCVEYKTGKKLNHKQKGRNIFCVLPYPHYDRKIPGTQAMGEMQEAREVGVLGPPALTLRVELSDDSSPGFCRSLLGPICIPEKERWH